MYVLMIRGSSGFSGALPLADADVDTEAEADAQRSRYLGVQDSEWMSE